MTAFDYGNARLRARKSQLFGAGDYRLLLAAADLDGLLGMLSGTRYGPDIEAVLPRYRSIRRLDGAVTLNLGRTLGEIGSFYEGEAARGVGLLLERWDLRNLQAVLRGVAGRVPPAEIVTTIVPAGTVAPAVLRSLAGATSLRALLDLFVALGVPSRRRAMALAGSWPAYERTGDPAQLELALHHMYWARWETSLGEIGSPSLTRLFLREADRADLLAALRFTTHPRKGITEVVASHRWLPGTISSNALAAAAGATSREDCATLLAPHVPPVWAGALEEWVASGDVVRAGGAIDAAITREMTALFTSGDPLSVDIPVAFVATLESEARNVRWVGRSVAAGRPPDAAIEMLVMPW